MDIENLTKSKRNYWRLDRAGLELKKEIFKLTRTIEVFLLAAFVILILVWIPYFVTPTNMRRVDFSVILMWQYVPHLAPIYTIFLICFIILTLPMCISWILHFLYFSWQVHLQVFILTEFIKDLGVNIDEDSVITHYGVVLDEYYQRCVWKNLIFIIQRHVELLSYHREVIKDLRVNITSVLLGISGTCLCFTGMWMAIVENEVRAGLLIPVCLIFVEIISFSAQDLENTFLAIYDLALEAPWYQWNIKNRKAYLLLVQQSAQVVPYPFFNTRVNRKFQLELLKIIYLAGSFLVNFYF